VQVAGQAAVAGATGVCTQGPTENGPQTAYWVGLNDSSLDLIAQAGFAVNCDGASLVIMRGQQTLRAIVFCCSSRFSRVTS
jgi:hypothetical protein